MRILPLGAADFEALRLDQAIYVDKTDLIYELASQRRSFFFTRPRRFGKSLFQNGLRDFKGLKIEQLWKEERTYPVIVLNFSLFTYSASR